MHGALPSLALELGGDERTLRRAVVRGAIRCRRTGPRRLRFDPGEVDYLRGHWPLLNTLTRALRTEPNVRLAVLYGSLARGGERADSDVDLLVDLRDATPQAATALAMRLERVVNRSVDVARLDQVRPDAPLLLMQALQRGRVLVDREALWPRLRNEQADVVLAAQRALDNDRRKAADSLRMLIEDA
ncbi:MAG: nucleotidyltransferase family protein [Solirubrobacteraceae bacterium]